MTKFEQKLWDLDAKATKWYNEEVIHNKELDKEVKKIEKRERKETRKQARHDGFGLFKFSFINQIIAFILCTIMANTGHDILLFISEANMAFWGLGVLTGVFSVIFASGTDGGG